MAASRSRPLPALIDLVSFIHPNTPDERPGDTTHINDQHRRPGEDDEGKLFWRVFKRKTFMRHQ